MKKSTIGWIAWILVIVGALNWGLIGTINLNLVQTLFGVGTITRVIYILVGVGALYKIWKTLGK